MLTVEYLSIGNTRQVLEVFTGKGGLGQVYSRSYKLPADGRHKNFQLKFRMTRGLGLGRNLRYIDDLCFAQARSVDSDSLVITNPLLTGVSLFVDAGGGNDPGFSVTLCVRIE